MIDASTRTRQVLAAGPVAATATVTGTAIDRRGFESLVVSFAVGIGGIAFDATNRIDLRLQHSDDDSTWIDVIAADVNEILLPTGAQGSVGATGIVRSIAAAHAAASLTKVGYVGNKRHVRPVFTFSGAHATATPVQAQVSLTDGNAPVGI